jgi:hypothetical protein
VVVLVVVVVAYGGLMVMEVYSEKNVLISNFTNLKNYFAQIKCKTKKQSCSELQQMLESKEKGPNCTLSTHPFSSTIFATTFRLRMYAFQYVCRLTS